MREITKVIACGKDGTFTVHLKGCETRHYASRKQLPQYVQQFISIAKYKAVKHYDHMHFIYTNNKGEY
ncbi:MAG: hypothetical protein MJZ37_08515 [Bacilli bacterium]|nr:hypothetical protein [Bacilli bacterium]